MLRVRILVWPQTAIASNGSDSSRVKKASILQYSQTPHLVTIIPVTWLAFVPKSYQKLLFLTGGDGVFFWVISVETGQVFQNSGKKFLR